jgi:HK97 family phage prohead protease/HK97 family phage major capsid protein
MSDEIETRAEWDTAYINDLPDSAFACIDAGGEKDAEGKTVPRSLRHFPHHNAAGEVDRAHLANARARHAQDGTAACGGDHLASHAEAMGMMETRELTGEIEVRDIAKRELGLFIVPWDTVVETNLGPEMFVRGAFDEVDPTRVRLRMDHANPPTGKGISLEQRDDGGHMAFRVAKTARGDEQLTLASEGVSTGASVGFVEIPGGTTIEQRNGRRVRVHRKVDLREVSTTWQPAYERAAVTYIRSKEAEAEEAPVAEPEVAPVMGPSNSEVESAVRADLAKIGTSVDAFAEKMVDRIEKLEERSRSQFTIPADQPKAKPNRGEWVQAVLKMLSGERVPEMQIRALEELITTDNAGVVPDAISSELIGVIDPSRPFMNSTRRMETPASGLTLTVPVITQRPSVAVQAAEKDQVSSTKTLITSTDFVAATYAGGGDISLQLLKRSSPSYLSLYLELLAEAYALTTEAAAVADIMAAGINSGGALDPEALALGSAWEFSVGSSFKRGPDTIWMSSAAVSAFIDAKADGTNSPLYSQLSANFTAGGGVGGSIQGLRAVYVPAMDATANDVLIGPSRGFAWAEDGTFVLQVDVPALAGRDVAMVGIVWFAAMYPAAFTAYSVSGGGS